MSARTGYDDLVAQRGREVADEIVSMAEQYSDAAHRDWHVALSWAIEQHDRPHDPDLVAQQEENARLYADLVEPRGNASRPILYLANELGGDAFDHPATLTRAEAIHDAERWRLPPRASMRDELDWAAERARQAPMDDAEREG